MPLERISITTNGDSEMSDKPTDALVPIPPEELATVAGATSSAGSDQLNTVLTQIQSSLKSLSNCNNGGFNQTDMMLLMMVMMNSGGSHVVYAGGGGGFGGYGGGFGGRIFVNAAGGGGGGWPYGPG